MWKKVVYKVIYNIVALAIWLTLILTRVVQRNRFPQTLQGFICEDPSLSRNYKPNTYSFSTLENINYATPFIVMAFELAIHGRNSIKNFVITAIRCLVWTQQYFLVYFLNFFTLQFIKSISGFLRPYFLTECMPDLAINCTRGEFIYSNYVCTNPNITSFVHGDLGRSFPSLNTMIATYPMVFIIGYLQRRTTKVPVFDKIVFPIVATVAFTWSLFASITRITDHAHHSVDVVGAVILLIPFTLYLNYVGCKHFNVPSKLDTEEFNCFGIIKCSLCKPKTNGKIP